MRTTKAEMRLFVCVPFLFFAFLFWTVPGLSHLSEDGLQLVRPHSSLTSFFIGPLLHLFPLLSSFSFESISLYTVTKLRA